MSLGVFVVNPMSFTQEQFDKLPPLLPRGVFLDWLGWRSCDLSSAVKNGEIKCHKRPGHRRKYYKSELARVTKLAM